MTLQDVLRGLLRSRLYRTAVVVDLDNGLRYQGCVVNLRHEGPASTVMLAPEGKPDSPVELPLAHVVRVVPVTGRTPTGLAS